MNKVTLIGRMVANPELKFTPGTGTAVANFTIAVDRQFKKEGQPTADFINIVVWGKQAESTANYMHKGSLIAVNGRIQQRSYDNKEGKKVYIFEVVAEEIQFLDKKESANDAQSNQDTKDFGADMTVVDDGDIPF